MIYVTDEFSHTLDFLEKNHLMYCMEFDGEIESIVLQPYNPYDGINGRKYPMSTLFLGYRSDSLDAFAVQSDFGSKQPIKDPQRVEKLLPKLRSVYNMTRPGYLAAVKLAGSDQYIYKYLPGEVE